MIKMRVTAPEEAGKTCPRVKRANHSDIFDCRSLPVSTRTIPSNAHLDVSYAKTIEEMKQSTESSVDCVDNDDENDLWLADRCSTPFCWPNITD